MDRFTAFTDPRDFSCDPAVTCCFTGHRRHKLPCGGDPMSVPMRRLSSKLRLFITEAYSDGMRTFISGMADGTDLCCAGIVLSMKHSGRYEGIRLVCAVPYPEQFREMQTAADSYIYNACLHGCDEAVLVNPGFSTGCYRRRNAFMVDHSSRIICVFDPRLGPSGTMQTISFAKRSGLTLISEDISRDVMLTM